MSAFGHISGDYPFGSNLWMPQSNFESKPGLGAIVPPGWVAGTQGDYLTSLAGDGPPAFPQLDIYRYSFLGFPFYYFRSDWIKQLTGVDETGNESYRYNFTDEDGNEATVGDTVTTWSNAYQYDYQQNQGLGDARGYDPGLPPFGQLAPPKLVEKTYDLDNEAPTGPGWEEGPQRTFRGLEFFGFSFLEIFGQPLIDHWGGENPVANADGETFNPNEPLYSTAGTTNIRNPYKNTGASFLFVIDANPIVPDYDTDARVTGDEINQHYQDPPDPDDSPEYGSSFRGPSVQSGRLGRSRIQTLLRGRNPAPLQIYPEVPVPEMEDFGVEFYLDGWSGSSLRICDNPDDTDCHDQQPNNISRSPMLFGPQSFTVGGAPGINSMFGAFQGMGVDNYELVARKTPCPNGEWGPNEDFECTAPPGWQGQQGPPFDPGPSEPWLCPSFWSPSVEMMLLNRLPCQRKNADGEYYDEAVQPLRKAGLQALLIEYDNTTAVDHEKGTFSCRDRRASGKAFRIYGIGGDEYYYHLGSSETWQMPFAYRGYGLNNFVDKPWATNNWYEELKGADGEGVGIEPGFDHLYPTQHCWWDNPQECWKKQTRCLDSNRIPPTVNGMKSAPVKANSTLFHDKNLQIGGVSPILLDPREDVRLGVDGLPLVWHGFRGILYEFAMFEGKLSKGDRRKLFQDIYKRYGVALIHKDCYPLHDGVTANATGLRFPNKCGGCPC